MLTCLRAIWMRSVQCEGRAYVAPSCFTAPNTAYTTLGEDELLRLMLRSSTSPCAMDMQVDGCGEHSERLIAATGDVGGLFTWIYT